MGCAATAETLLEHVTHNLLGAEIRVQLSSQEKQGIEEKWPLTNQEIMQAKDLWIRKKQRKIPEETKSSGWKLERDGTTKIVRCIGRIKGYSLIYLRNGLFVKKLIWHVHEQLFHLGVASTMGAIREEWWIPRLRSLVEKMISTCHTCKVFSAKPYEKADTSPH